jgi:hypothetical protein
MRIVMLGAAAASLLLASVAGADQAKMREALGELRQARELLGMAADDKGGHRARAIELVDKAMDEVRQGIDFAEGR